MGDKKLVEQSGAVPYFNKNGNLYLVLITARNSAQNWIFPKGHIDNGHDHMTAARAECYEEAGVLGKPLSNKIGSFKYNKYGKDYRVTFYPLSVNKILQEWPESKQRKRTIVEFKDALTLLKNDDKLTKILKKTAEAVKPKQENL
ncbi:MAG: NUDIX hydrolase [Lentisphaerae bacterium]|nr:NUDIX hydrolase [Lentisphaerota bacterium]MCP4103415.1 NUDIX hydrolase [Lentisphaerota bacterium]